MASGRGSYAPRSGSGAPGSSASALPGATYLRSRAAAGAAPARRGGSVARLRGLERVVLGRRVGRPRRGRRGGVAALGQRLVLPLLAVRVGDLGDARGTLGPFAVGVLVALPDRRAGRVRVVVLAGRRTPVGRDRVLGLGAARLALRAAAQLLEVLQRPLAAAAAVGVRHLAAEARLVLAGHPGRRQRRGRSRDLGGAVVRVLAGGLRGRSLRPGGARVVVAPVVGEEHLLLLGAQRPLGIDARCVLHGGLVERDDQLVPVRLGARDQHERRPQAEQPRVHERPLGPAALLVQVDLVDLPDLVPVRPDHVAAPQLLDLDDLEHERSFRSTWLAPAYGGSPSRRPLPRWRNVTRRPGDHRIDGGGRPGQPSRSHPK